MKSFYKCIAGLLVLSMMGLYFPKVAFCGSSKLFAKADKNAITKHEPKIMSTPEEDIPMVESEEGDGKGSMKWILIGVGAAALVGLAAAAGGGGGGGDGGGNGGGSDTGSVNVSW